MRPAFLLLLATAVPCLGETATFPALVAPIFEHNCVKCHGPTKQKAGLRLDSHAAVLLGSKDGVVLKPGDPEGSELFRRISLSPSDDDFMPSGDRPPLTPSEISALRSWIASGAPGSASFDVIPLEPAAAPQPPAAPDYGPRLAQATALARSLGVKLAPRSRIPTDGLVLRTASDPAVCDDAVLARLAPVGDLIVEAELARTRVTDKGMQSVGTWVNLERLDVTRTGVTSDGVALLAQLGRLDSLNLTQIKVDDRGIALAKQMPSLRHLWAFEGP